jgi:uncharacterized RDD family membrane protein YckC
MLKIFKKDPNSKYAGSIVRSVAAAIDMFIANIIRITVFAILGELWLKQQLINFQTEFKLKFDSDQINGDPEKIQFLVHSQLFTNVLLTIFMVFISGAFYYILFNQSKWRATIGKRIMKIIIIDIDGEKLTFFQSLSHYFLSIFPWLFVFYIFSYQMMHQINIYKAITENTFNLIFGLATLAWLQIHLITKRKTTAPDLICKTMVVKMNYDVS